MIKFNPNSTHNIVIKNFDKEYDYGEFKAKVYDNGWVFLNTSQLDGIEVSFQIEFRNLLSKYFDSFSKTENVFENFHIGLNNEWIKPEECISLKLTSGTLDFQNNSQVVQIDLSKIIISSSVFDKMIQSQFNNYIPIE